MVILAITVVVGACVQGLIGLGLGIVGAPVFMMLAPNLMPATLLIATSLLPALMLVREWRGIEWHGVSWALVARLPGGLVGAWLVGVLSHRALGIGVAIMVLAAVGLTATKVRVPITRTSWAVAGFTAGVTGTATSIGGPPVALLVQHRPAAALRPTLSVFFLCGTILSVGSLALNGSVTTHQAVLGLVLMPAVLAGFGLAQAVRRVADPERVRIPVLLLCAFSALVLLLRSLG